MPLHYHRFGRPARRDMRIERARPAPSPVSEVISPTKDDDQQDLSFDAAWLINRARQRVSVKSRR